MKQENLEDAAENMIECDSARCKDRRGHKTYHTLVGWDETEKAKVYVCNRCGRYRIMRER